MRLSVKITLAAASAVATLVPAGIAHAAPVPVPLGSAVHIDHVLTDTHITSSVFAGNAASGVQLFEDYDANHTAGEKWIFLSADRGRKVLIQNSGGDFCLQPGDPANTDAAVPIVQRSCSVTKKAQWWTPEGNGTSGDFTIRPSGDDGLAITPATNDRYAFLRLAPTDGPGHFNQLFRVREDQV